MIKVVAKAWFRKRWRVYAMGHLDGDWFWVATFKNQEDATNWAYGLTGKWALKPEAA